CTGLGLDGQCGHRAGLGFRTTRRCRGYAGRETASACGRNRFGGRPAREGGHLSGKGDSYPRDVAPVGEKDLGGYGVGKTGFGLRRQKLRNNPTINQREPTMKPYNYKLALAVAAATLTLTGSPLFASSHQDAPLAVLDPAANTTDVYAFVDQDDHGP